MVSNSLTDRLLGFDDLCHLLRFAMLIVCPSCATSYRVEPASLGEGGRSVRCARCQNVWFATLPLLIQGGSDDWDVVDAGQVAPEMAANNSITQTPSTGGIDVAGLSAEIANERAEQIAEADQVLAEVAQEIAAAEEATPAADGPAVEAEPVRENIETAAARRSRRDALRRRNWLKPGLPAAILALAAANVSVVVWRNDVVRLLPQTAPLYAAVGLPVNVRGLTFENVRMSRAEHEGVGVLVVEGSIINVTGKPVEVPRLRLAVRNEAKNEVYAWTALPSRTVLPPGEALPFRSRLASPPADARDVQVRFFNKRDVLAGLN